jgi:3-deoxy-manno-octulosonate cytidylyltransferase (CMP-KDO synthetase)
VKSLVVIPARYGSTRLPGKPLLSIRGYSLIQRVYAIAATVVPPHHVIVATDDSRIADHVLGFGGRAVFTDPECKNGTERVSNALFELKESYDAVLNLQGDAVLTPPWILRALIETLAADRNIEIATPAVRLSEESYAAFARQKSAGSSSGTLVVTNVKGDALYFSKAMIPFIRGSIDSLGEPEALRHIGLYAYTKEGLAQYMALQEGRIEKQEKLEQLRVLESGRQIRVVEVSYQGRTHGSVDNPEDVPLVEEIIDNEGELVDCFCFEAKGE